MQEYQLDFITYCVGNLSERLNMSASKVYKMLHSSGVLDGYIVPCYDVLHTFSKDYIMNDLIELLKKRGTLAWNCITHQIVSLSRRMYITHAICLILEKVSILLRLKNKRGSIRNAFCIEIRTHREIVQRAERTFFRKLIGVLLWLVCLQNG